MQQYQGVWTLQAQAQAQSNQQWVTDPNFKNTTLLLQADNALNGVQNNTFLDSSSNSFTITRNGSATQGSFTPFDTNWSNYFVSSGSSTLGFANNSAFSFGAPSANANDFSVEFFVYPTTAAISIPVGTGYTSGTTYWSFQLNRNTSGTNSPGYVQFYLTDNFNVTATTGLVSNQWNHICAVRTGTTVSLFVNGIRQATDTSSVNPNPTGSLYVGGDGGFLARYIDGYVSNVRIVKGATTPYSATASRIAVPDLNLSVTTGTTILTCQSNNFVDNASGLAITVIGTPSVQNFSPFAPQYQWTAPVIGGSGYFDGTGDYLTTPTSTNLSLGTVDFTCETWFYPTVTGANPPNQKPIVYQYNQSNGGFIFYWTAASAVRVLVAAGTQWNIDFTTSSVPLNSWCHIALVRSGTTFYIFINGNLVHTASSISGTLGTIAVPVLIGGGNAGLEIITACYIASCRLVKGTALYTSTFTPSTAPLTAITNTSLLLNFTNAGIYDGTMKNNLETLGNAQVSTSVVKYGSGSMYFDGTGDYLSLPTNTALTLGSGNWTIEFWVYANALPSAGLFINLMDQRPASTNGVYPNIAITDTGAIRFFVNSTQVIISSVISLGTWFHFALCKNSTSTKMFINGVQSGSTYTDSNNYLAGSVTAIAASSFNLGTNTLNGYFDDFRITKGIARYTANFTPPQVALPRQ
jgi:hypothetical protein